MRAAAALAARIRGSQHARAKSHRTGAQLSDRARRSSFSQLHDSSLSGLRQQARHFVLSEGDSYRGVVTNDAQKLYQELYAVLSNGEILSDADFTSVIP